jgi:hypothetical protein
MVGAGTTESGVRLQLLLESSSVARIVRKSNWRVSHVRVEPHGPSTASGNSSSTLGRYCHLFVTIACIGTCRRVSSVYGLLRNAGPGDSGPEACLVGTHPVQKGTQRRASDSGAATNRCRHFKLPIIKRKLPQLCPLTVERSDRVPFSAY